MQLSPDLLCLQRCMAKQSPPDRLGRWRPQYQILYWMELALSCDMSQVMESR